MKGLAKLQTLLDNERTLKGANTLKRSNKNLICQGNSLIESSYTLSMMEKRLVNICMSKLDSRPGHKNPDAITVTAEEFSDLYGVDIKKSYGHIKQALKKLQNQRIKFKEDNWDVELNWVQKSSYIVGGGAVKVMFSNDVIKHLIELHGEFTSFRIMRVAKLKSVYSIRLFELLSQFKNAAKNKKTGTITRRIKVEDFRKHLGIDKQFPLFSQLKRWVVNPAIEELRVKADLVIDYTTKKTGKKVTEIEFQFYETDANKQKSLPL